MSHDGSSLASGTRCRGRGPHLVSLAVVLVLAFGVALPAALTATRADAQSAAPTLPAAPDPALCTVEPRSIDEYQVDTGTPVPPPVSFTIAAGRPADQATIDAVTTTMVEAAACINSGDLKRLDRLYTDVFFNGTVDQGYYDFLAAEHDPAPTDQRYAIFAIALVQVLDDGRVAAIVQFQTRGAGGADLMLFAEQGGRYLIDKWVDGPFDIEPNFGMFGEEATPAVSTPTA